MNRNSKVRCLEDIGQIYANKANSKAAGFTKGRVYIVVAGLGDGDISRTDGKVGGFLLNPNQVCLKDDFGNIRLMKIDHRFEVVSLAASCYPPRVPVTHLYKPVKVRHIPRAAMGEFTAADASP